MKKYFSYALIFVIGTACGILVLPRLKSKKQEPIFHTTTPAPTYVSGNNPDAAALRQVNSQQLHNSRQTVITEAVKKISPAVVGINILQIQQYRSRNWLFDDPWFRHFFPESGGHVVKGLGSGFIISPEGYIVTNEHVVNQAVQIVVTLPNGEKYDAELMASDYISDIALLKITAKGSMPYVTLGNSDDLIIGEWAIAFGNPFGLFDMGQPSVSQGIISATDRDFGKQNDSRVYKDMIQTDAAINSGNSGGPLVNSLGEVIGINTFIFSGSDRTGTSIGLGFAIPINRTKKIIRELRLYGKVNRRFRTGLEIDNLTYRLARYFGLNSTDGVIISNVESNSPAEQAGLKIGDIIVEINEYPIRDTENIWQVIDDLDAKGGDILTLKIIRNRKYLKISLRLEEIR